MNILCLLSVVFIYSTSSGSAFTLYKPVYDISPLFHAFWVSSVIFKFSCIIWYQFICKLFTSLWFFSICGTCAILPYVANIPIFDDLFSLLFCMLESASDPFSCWTLGSLDSAQWLDSEDNNYELSLLYTNGDIVRICMLALTKFWLMHLSGSLLFALLFVAYFLSCTCLVLYVVSQCLFEDPATSFSSLLTFRCSFADFYPGRLDVGSLTFLDPCHFHLVVLTGLTCPFFWPFSSLGWELLTFLLILVLLYVAIGMCINCKRQKTGEP